MILWITTAVAASISPFGAVTPAEEVAVGPYLFVYPDHLDASLFVSQGYGRVDLFLGATGTYRWPRSVSAGPLEVFPRFFVTDWLALVPHVIWVPGQAAVTAGVETHWNVTKGRFTFLANAGWRPIIDAHGLAAGTAYALVAPEVYLVKGRFSAFVELDPTVDLTTHEWTANVLPGLSWIPSAKHADNVALGVQIPVRGGLPALVLNACWFP
jgi:hypothetical protein